jgi:methyl-accepting chemotaxis protein
LPQAAKGTGGVSSNISGVSQAASEAAAASGQVQTASAHVAKQSKTLGAEVERFLAGIRGRVAAR